MRPEALENKNPQGKYYQGKSPKVTGIIRMGPKRNLVNKTFTISLNNVK